MTKVWQAILGFLGGLLAVLGLGTLFSGKKKEEIKKLDDVIKQKDKEVKLTEKKVKQLEAKKKINKTQVKKLKKEVETTKADIKKAQKASEIGDVDEAVNFLKKFSK
jgi:septal ring factor EnvC (AmiA/AmiB activator)|tara:strand:+ start:234 stop:554 length:321 start_codon:yes stop_codon:yes gene_type:complete